MRCLPKSVVSYFWGCRVNFHRCFSKGFALLVSILCSLCLLVGLGIKKYHLKLICRLFCALCASHAPLSEAWFHTFGLPCQFSHVLSILFKRFCLVSILCSLCLLVGLGVKEYNLKLICFVSVALVVSILRSLCLLVGLGVNKLSS